MHPEQLDPGPIPEYKSFKVIQEPPLPDLRGQIPDSSDIDIQIEPLTEAEKQQEEEMFADYDSKNPYEDDLPDYFDDEDEEPQG